MNGPCDLNERYGAANVTRDDSLPALVWPGSKLATGAPGLMCNACRHRGLNVRDGFPTSRFDCPACGARFIVR